MIDPVVRRPVSLLILIAVALCGCSTIPPAEQVAATLRGTTLNDAEKLLIYAQASASNPQAAAVCRLRAAEIAWSDLAKHGSSVRSLTSLPSETQRAVRLYNEATAGIAPLVIRNAPTTSEQTYSSAGYSYRVEPAGVTRRGEHRPSEFESAVRADEVPHKLVRNWYKEEGVGAALAPRCRMPSDEAHLRFASQRGYNMPITAVLQFDGAGAAHRVRIGYFDPQVISDAEIGNTRYPLAADFTAPIVERYRGVNETSLALGGLLSSNVREARYGLGEPYDPHRIPIVFIHGLNSHPLMWREVVNDLRADPELRDKYQFLFFYYPTGWPPAYSALRLREEMVAFDKVYGRQHNMILVGHSMGGIVARLQVISPGRTIWDAQLGPKADEAYKNLPASHLGKRTFIFEANPEITREIYICVPHRGSKMADWSVVGLFTKFIKMPFSIMAAAADVPGIITERRQLSSVNRLSPNNPLYSAMDRIPIEVPYHSIIGDRGKGDTPNSSDGVVQYWSSHLKGAQSELIVPGPHGSYSLPVTIAELKRILKLHLTRTGQSTATAAGTP
jgi:hypothetical protein